MEKYLKKPDTFFETFERKEGNPGTTHYCPGCGHGIVQKLLAEAIDDLEIQDKTILIVPGGCALFMYHYLELAALSTAPGRAPATASAIAHTDPEVVTLCYQEACDLATLGAGHLIHAAHRGENILVLYVNNRLYNPVVPLDSNSHSPRFPEVPPLKLAEIVAGLDSPGFVARSAVSSPQRIMETKELIRHGLQVQKDHRGFALIEILSPCPNNWHMTPVEAAAWLENNVLKTYAMGILKDVANSNIQNIPKRTSINFQDSLKALHLEPIQLFEASGHSLPKDEFKITIAGFPEQGVLSLGRTLANLGLKKGLEVSLLPYTCGQNQTGEAQCSVVFSESPVISPMVDRPDLLVAMNKPALYQFGPLVPKTGDIFYNKTLVDSVPRNIEAKLYPLDASSLAVEAGNIKTANTVFLAFLAGHLGLFTREELHRYVDETFDNPILHTQNGQAVECGWNAAADDY